MCIIQYDNDVGLSKGPFRPKLLLNISTTNHITLMPYHNMQRCHLFNTVAYSAINYAEQIYLFLYYMMMCYDYQENVIWEKNHYYSNDKEVEKYYIRWMSKQSYTWNPEFKSYDNFKNKNVSRIFCTSYWKLCKPLLRNCSLWNVASFQWCFNISW